MRVLGIESSCDETGVAVYDSAHGLLSEALYSQIELHSRYGGVVPELASRDHIRKILPLIDEVLRGATSENGQENLPEDVSKSSENHSTTSKTYHLQNTARIDAIAYTAGPGLVGALLVGATVAQSLAFGWNIPAIGIHHMEGHLLSPLMESGDTGFPFLALLVSGGHTLLVDVKALGDYTVLGQSVDDAVGEAFDKTAKLMGLPYPGGPQLAALADVGDSQAYDFPRPMLKKPGLNFSFSGLKTAVLLAWNKSAQDEEARANIAASFQAAVVETLVTKVKRAIKHTGRGAVVVAGGVGANRALRASLTSELAPLGARAVFPPARLCTDNGAMIAYAGWRRLQRDPASAVAASVRPRWPLDELT